MRGLFAVFISVFLAELGDKTQVATFLFATDPNLNRTGVFLASTVALALSSLIAVVIGGSGLPIRFTHNDADCRWCGISRHWPMVFVQRAELTQLARPEVARESRLFRRNKLEFDPIPGHD